MMLGLIILQEKNAYEESPNYVAIGDNGFNILFLNA